MGDETLLERILNGHEEPKDLPLALLQSITNDFSDDRKIGQGGFGVVYKGELQNGIIAAVKRIEVNQITIDDVSFRREFNSLMNTNHPNVVRFLGFCSNTHHIPRKEAGEISLVNVRERLLCFGYISNGSLDKHITDELRRIEWEPRYAIISGICKGLFYLHKEKKFVSSKTGSNPCHISLEHLKDITDNFSEDRILGSGGFGVVYKGVLQGEIVAVKKLAQPTPKSHKQFMNEVDLLMTLEHPNIVRLVGYCYDTQQSLMPFEGKMVIAHSIERFLCLECMPNGSLDKYISDVSSGLDWHKRCKIIEGISFGLQYLHEEANGPIIHLDLKPANILLGENLVPKITDFGLSRLFDQKTMHTTVASGTLGYMAVEYQQRGIITPMADIFSLGVIILEVITGHKDYPYPYEIRTRSEEFIKLELQKWRNRLHKEPVYTSLEIDCQQIERYIQIGLICVNTERGKRPTMNKIIDMLQGLESMDWYIRNELSSQIMMEEP